MGMVMDITTPTRMPMTMARPKVMTTSAPEHAAVPADAMGQAAVWLQLMWLASPALPVGGFSYSEGLEAAVEAGRVQDEPSACAWLRDQLALSLGRSELPLLVQALAAWRTGDLARVQDLNDWMRTTRESAESRLQTEQMGRSMVEWLRNRLTPADSSDGTVPDPRVAALAALTPAPTWPVAFALAAAQTHADTRAVALSFAFGWCENMVQAALKAVPLGQNAGQRILAALAHDIPAVVERALTMGDDERQAATPMLAILASHHETQYTRLFRS